MPKRDIVVIGASTGGVEALQQLVELLPEEFPGAIFIVMHTGPGSILPEILSRAGKIRAVSAEDKMSYERNRIYVAPPDRHLLINDGVMQLDAGPRENGSRPSIDPLFRSAARTHRERVAGVILTGKLDDGAAGLYAVKARGGLTIVPDPTEAAAPDIPLNAMRHTTVDHWLSLTGISALLSKIASEESLPGEVSSQDIKQDRNDLVDPAERMKSPPPNETQISLSCPECNGSLYEEKEGDMAHFRCHVGHSFSPQSLSEAHKEVLERALWTAVRTLNERVMMHRQFLRRERNGAEEILFKRFQESAAGAERDVELLRDIISRV